MERLCIARSLSFDTRRMFLWNHRQSTGPLKFLVLRLVLPILLASFACADDFTLKVIAINDFHGNLMPPGLPAGSKLPDVPAGGIDMLAGYVQDLKSRNPYHVVVAAGDLIGGSPLVSALFHDEGTIETMNLLGLEVSSVGNHEFDKGLQELLRMQSGGCSTVDERTCQGAQVGTPVPFQGAKFPYLAANVLDESTERTIFPAYSIKNYNGVPVAFIGLTLKDTPTVVSGACVASLRFLDEAGAVNAVVNELRAQGVQSFIVLIHQGGEQTATKGVVDINGCQGDLKGSAIERIVNQLDDGVGLVLSAHTHAAYNCQIANRVGRKIPVTSAASYGLMLSDIDVTIDTGSKRITGVKASNMMVRRDAGITADAGVKAIVDRYADLAKTVINSVVGTASDDFAKKGGPSGESSLGDLIADAQLEATSSSGAVAAFMNPAGIRADLKRSSNTEGVPDGHVTYGQLLATQPFGNDLVTMTLTGAQIKTLLEEQFKGCTVDFPAEAKTGRDQDTILQVSRGFTYTYNPAAKPCSKVDAKSMKIGAMPVVPTKKYRVTMNSFLAGGGDQFYEFTHGTERVGETQECVGKSGDIQALIAFFKKHDSVSASRQKRINISQEATR